MSSLMSNRPLRRTMCLLGLAFWAAVGGAACERTSSEDQTATKQEREAEAARAQAEAGEEAEERERLDAFGLPLPPRVLRVKRYPRKIKVHTDMTMNELEAFYSKHLIDYEVIASGHALRAIPLRAHMPIISGLRPFGPRYPKEIIYKLPPKAIEVADASDGSAQADPSDASGGQNANTTNTDDAEARGRAGARRGAAAKGGERYGPPPKGTPVRTRTDDGQLLAPGAKWGSPTRHRRAPRFTRSVIGPTSGDLMENGSPTDAGSNGQDSRRCPNPPAHPGVVARGSL